MITITMAESKKSDDRPVAVNKKAFRDFILVERFEAGLSLLGSEVKSLRNGSADLAGSYAKIEDGQCWLVGTTIAQYEQAGIRNHEPTRKRKLLLHKSEIRKLWTKLEQRGFTLVPLRIYFSKRSLAKVELALAHGKRKYDKRRSITERDQRRDIDRDLRKYK
jgi:SsrA-binding protein